MLRVSISGRAARHQRVHRGVEVVGAAVQLLGQNRPGRSVFVDAQVAQRAVVDDVPIEVRDLVKRYGEIVAVEDAQGSVAPVPLRALATEKFLMGHRIASGKLDSAVLRQARETLVKEISPINDIRSTMDYRLTVAAHLLEDFLCGTGLVN